MGLTSLNDLSDRGLELTLGTSSKPYLYTSLISTAGQRAVLCGSRSRVC